MSAKNKDERINEMADSLFNLVVAFYHLSSCDNMRCRYDGEWECPRCEAKPIIDWILAGDKS